jgi:thiol-disulfide isomerase/thioredoxin
MSKLAGLPGWLLVAVWLAVPAVAIALVVFSITGDDDDPGPGSVLGLGTADVDVQTPELQRQRIAAGVSDCPAPASTPPDDPALPVMTLPCLGGDDGVDLSDLSGPLVLNFWAQSCGPCRDEMPVLQRLHTSTTAVSVLGVDFQDLQPGKALDLAAASGATYPSVADVEGDLQAPLRVTALPTTLFVDAAGRVVATERRAFTSYAELTTAVERHLGVRL